MWIFAEPEIGRLARNRISILVHLWISVLGDVLIGLQVGMSSTVCLRHSEFILC